MLDNHANNICSAARGGVSRNETRRGAETLFVQGTAFSNSAAKFWSALADELHSDYPECDEIVLETLTDTLLSRELLFPASSLQNEIGRRLPLSDLKSAMLEAIADFEIMGPPDSVRARLCSRGVERKRFELPFDCVDADVFPLLLVWLLEWSGIPECLWNSDHVEGRFDACDRGRKIRYHIGVTLANEHVSEGLYRRTLAMRCKRGITG